MRPFRFAVTARSASSAEAWRETARSAEGLGYDVLFITDHMGEQLAPVPALMAALDATTALRASSFVFANDYRNPLMLAKEIATLDLLSSGRIELGIGAGWNTGDYRQLGIRYDPPAVRVARMEESVRLLKRLFTEEVVDHSGEHYTLRGARLLPRPVQRPYPPLMIGGGGPRVLRFAAAEADIVAFAPQTNARGGPRLSSLTTRALEERVDRLRRVAGERLSRLELNVITFDAGVTDHAPSLIGALAAALKRGVNGVVRSPFLLYGSRASLVALLLAQRERTGISFIAIPERAMRSFAPVVSELRGR